MAWTNLTFSFGAILTSAQMTQLDDNLDALAAGDAGAPSIVEAALAAAVAAKLVTSGNSHNHSGGDGALIPNAAVIGLGSCALISSVTAAYLASDAVIQAKVKTALGSQSASLGAGGTLVDVILDAYCFFPDIVTSRIVSSVNNATHIVAHQETTPSGNADAPTFSLYLPDPKVPYDYDVDWRYITAA